MVTSSLQNRSDWGCGANFYTTGLDSPLRLRDFSLFSVDTGIRALAVPYPLPIDGLAPVGKVTGA
jgi:hypothetical protein